MLERGKRRLTASLARKFMRVYRLDPTVLPPSDLADRPGRTSPDELARQLAALGYPGFAYLRPYVAKKNPAEVLLTALAQDNLEARVAEALPWLLLQDWEVDSNWLAEQAKRFDLQNRLGFVVSLARQVSESNRRNDQRSRALSALESVLERSRLAREDVFFRAPRTPAEREWLMANRPEEARHWNLLADLRREHLGY